MNLVNTQMFTRHLYRHSCDIYKSLLWLIKDDHGHWQDVKLNINPKILQGGGPGLTL